MKTTSLYVQFLLINVVKFNVFLNTAQNAIHHVQELFFFWPKRYTAIQSRRCSSIILTNAAGRTSQFAGALAVQIYSD